MYLFNIKLRDIALSLNGNAARFEVGCDSKISIPKTRLCLQLLRRKNAVLRQPAIHS